MYSLYCMPFPAIFSAKEIVVRQGAEGTQYPNLSCSTKIRSMYKLFLQGFLYIFNDLVLILMKQINLHITVSVCFFILQYRTPLLEKWTHSAILIYSARHNKHMFVNPTSTENTYYIDKQIGRQYFTVYLAPSYLLHRIC